MDGMEYSAGVEIDEASGDAVVTLPPELIARLDLKPGDTLRWELHEDGVVTLSKAEG